MAVKIIDVAYAAKYDHAETCHLSLRADCLELEARRVAFAAMVADPFLSEEKRTMWAEGLQEIVEKQEELAAKMAADPRFYETWLVMEDNEALLKPMRRFPQ